MKIQDLKKLVLISKKTSKELSQAYCAIVKQVELKTIGTKNSDLDETEIIISSCKKELKEQNQSKKLGAPFSKDVISICEKLIKELSPEQLSIEEITKEVENVISNNPEFKMPEIMKHLKNKYKQGINMQLASTIVKNKI